MLDIVLASGNRHKYEELSAFFKKFKAFDGVVLHSGDDFPNMEDVDESGTTYEQNALLKATAWSRFTGLPALADDSGLEVRALGWEPGIYSARAAVGSDEERVSWLLSRMDGLSDRRACFVASLVIVSPSVRSAQDATGRSFFAVEGRCWGSIAAAPSGGSGFGYDPIFIPDGYDKSFAELGESVKSEISHRSIAVQGLAKIMPSVVKYLTVYDSKK